jgi:hypothetical protein
VLLNSIWLGKGEEEEEKPGFMLLANFCGVNAPIMASFNVIEMGKIYQLSFADCAAGSAHH